MSWEKNNNKPIVVIGTTNRPDSLDATLCQAGRFDHDHEISMGVLALFEIAVEVRTFDVKLVHLEIVAGGKHKSGAD